MQSTNIRQIKAALRDQAFLGTTQVSCPLGPVVAESLVEGAPAGYDPWMGSLVPRGECAHRGRRLAREPVLQPGQAPCDLVEAFGIVADDHSSGCYTLLMVMAVILDEPLRGF